MTKTSRPDIFSYRDYREFLEAWFLYKKATQTKFSLRQLAKKAGLASGYLPMVLGGTRPLSAAVLAKLMPHLGLNSSEQAFLESLLGFRNSSSNDVNLAALERMKRFQQFQKLNPEETAVSDYLTHWYCVAIREMANVPKFKADPEWILKRLNYSVTLKEVKDALEFLFSAGFLKKKKGGGVEPPQRSLDCSGEVFKVALAKFHRELLALAAQSIEKSNSNERNIQGHTVALSAGSFKKAGEIVNEAIRKIQDLGRSEKNGEFVYHMEVALFPLSGGERK